MCYDREYYHILQYGLRFCVELGNVLNDVRWWDSCLHNTLCIHAHARRLLDIQMGDYIPPSVTTSNHPPSTCLYGSELIRQSLEASKGDLATSIAMYGMHVYMVEYYICPPPMGYQNVAKVVARLVFRLWTLYVRPQCKVQLYEHKS